MLINDDAEPPETIEEAVRRQHQQSKGRSRDSEEEELSRINPKDHQTKDEETRTADVDPPQPDFVESRSSSPELTMDLDALGPDLYHLSPGNESVFFRFKEQQYARRREHLNEYCNVIRALYDPGMKNPMMDISPHCILYDKPDGLSHCSIAKV